jgi:Ti-type conjugative transfer relaxase TraA
MAIFHFSAKVIGRGSGSSAVASAAYRSASRLHDERLDRAHDFTNKAGVVHSEVMLPDGAPEHLGDREKLWNAIEAAEVRKDAQLAREIEFAIPREMDQAQGISLARDFVRREFVDKGMIADLNVHWDIGVDGEPKPHAHVMLSMREVSEGGFGSKVRNWNSTELLRQWRDAWAVHANERMAEVGIEARIDDRSYEAQGIALEPQDKIGPAGARRLERGEDAERATDHLEIARRNGEKIIASPQIALDAITHQQSTFTVCDMAKMAHRHSSGQEQFNRVLGAMKGADQLVALGRDGRSEERFTSRSMIEVELSMARNADRLERIGHAVADQHVEHAIVHANDNGLILSGEQRDALKHVTRGRDLGLVIGYAGSGKSAMLGVARDAWEAEGYTVRGAALSGIAAENLEQGSGIPSRTIASLEYHWARDRERLTPNDILVIDESGMIGSRQMERILHEAARAGAKVVLVGDAQQLQAIEAGAAFRALAERHGAVEISEIRRQHEDWQRDATRQLATGRTGEALRAYGREGMIRVHDTRKQARQALIDGWQAARDNAPAQSQLILSHTRNEVRALNDLARDALKRDGTLIVEISVKTARGERLFAVNDRVMFLRNERDLGVKNGTLATVEQATPERIDARLDDGRSVGFDIKHYADIDHGYAATIHKSQGVTVDRVHVLATPGLDQHSSYVALSRHRENVHLHYGRDDFDGPERLARVLGRERAKDSTLDYQMASDGFAKQRGYERSAILDALAKQRFADPARTRHEPAPRRGMFDGLRLTPHKERPVPARGMFDGIRIEPAVHAPAGQPGDVAQRLDRAVRDHARAIEEAGRMIARNLPPLEYQKAALARTRDALDAVRPGAAVDLGQAFVHNPGLAAEAANGRTTLAIRAMQIEAEVRADPELRADRFVQAWRRHLAERDRLKGWEHDGARGAVESRMKALAKGIDKDPTMAKALGKHAGDLGLGKQRALEWRPGSRDGGIGRDMIERMRTPSMAQQLIDSLGRGRDLGMSR